MHKRHKIMGKKIVKDGWVYDYDISVDCRKKYDCELTDVRYVLGEQLDMNKQNVLICIGINPSMAMPKFLDPTLRRVQDYANKKGKYGAWYMVNVYPQRATDPNDMDKEPNMEIHRNNLIAIKNLLSEIKEADVWCAWRNIIGKRKYLHDLLFGNAERGIDGIISLFSGNYHFKAYDATTKGYPKHPLMMGEKAELRSLNEVGLKELSDRIVNKAKK